MKKTAKIIFAVLLALSLAFGALYAYAEVAEYSSEDDPLVSLSYIDRVLLPMIKELIVKHSAGEDISDIGVATTEDTKATEPTEATEPATEATTEVTEPEEPEEPEIVYPDGTVNTGTRYEVIHMEAGDTIYASLTSLEVIVRSGGAKVVSPFTVKYEEQGLSDTTEGKELYNGADVPKNHTVLIPRDDGRGIVIAEGGAWLMVRGDYILESVKAEIAAAQTEEASNTEASEPASDTENN